jgi:hypothetical protein
MNIIIEHPSVYKLTREEWEFLLSGNKLCSYFNNMNKLVDKISKKNPFIDIPTLKGHLYEIFVELFIKCQPLKFRDYHPNDKIDWGVDGAGIAANDKPFAIQCKLRQDNKLITYGEGKIAHFILQAIHDFNVDPDTKTNLIIFTSGPGLHNSIANGIPSINKNKIKLVCYNYKNQTKLVDNNENFWKIFREAVNEKIN